MKARAAGAIVIALVLTVAGCRHWVPIKPADLPRLNETGWVQTPDGTIVELFKPFDVNITMPPHSIAFTHPVTSSMESEVLVVRGSNRGRTAFPLKDVTRVSVSQPDPEKTTIAAGVVLTAAVLSLLYLVLRASTTSSL